MRRNLVIRIAIVVNINVLDHLIKIRIKPFIISLPFILMVFFIQTLLVRIPDTECIIKTLN